MRRSILLATMALLLACGTAEASEWVSVGMSVHKIEIFIDVSSIRVTGGIHRAWVKLVHHNHDQRGNGDDAGKWLSHSVSRDAFNCTEETTRAEALTWYFEDGTNHVVSPASYPDPWRPVAPDTIDSATMQFICAWKPK